MGPAVDSLCFLASAGCGYFLVRSDLDNPTKLLLWSAVCFVLLALNNFLLVLDLVFFPVEIDLSLIRPLVSLAGVSAILYGFIGELD